MVKYFVHRKADNKILRYFKNIHDAKIFLNKIRTQFYLADFSLGKIEDRKTEFNIKET